jgi:glyoxylase-like metal-dependent hydrolase (beta-lactamase superfamily II)
MEGKGSMNLQGAFDLAGMTVFERGWLSSNNVLFDGGESTETVLVDSGYCTHSAQTLALVRQVLGNRPLGRIVNTHLHSDHCGGNSELQSAYRCAIDVPLGEASKVDAWIGESLTFEATGQHCPQFQRTGSIADGSRILCGHFVWEAIASPGHDPESVVLYQRDLEILISADALWKNGFGVIFPELEGLRAFDDTRRTLELLGSLSAKWIVPGHGAPFQGLHQAVDRALARLEKFTSDPTRHARHAAKVLIKFHLLEVERADVQSLIAWAKTGKYLRLVHEHYFKPSLFADWLQVLLNELKEAGAVSILDGFVVNR